MGILKNIADAHNICILLVHHLRKAPDPGDPFARILGTQGTSTGACPIPTLLWRARNARTRPPTFTAKAVM